MSKFLKSVWERVILSYKSTLVGLGAGIGLVIIDQFVQYVGALQGASPYLKAAAALAVVIGSALRSKALPPATPTP